MFDGLKQDTPILTSTEPDTLCRYDLEVSGVFGTMHVWS